MFDNLRTFVRYLIDKKHYNADYALSVLADEFLPLSGETLWLIVSQTGYYKDK